MHKFLHEVFQSRKKELNVSTKWIVEHTTLNDRTAARLLSGESTDGLFSNVLEISNALSLSLGDLDPAFVEAYAGKRLNEVLKDYVDSLQDNAALKIQLEELRTESEAIAILSAQIQALQGKIDALNAENDLLRMQISHKDEIIAVHNLYAHTRKRRRV